MEKGASVHSSINFRGNNRSLCWNLQFIGDFHDWELEDMMDILYSRQISEGNNCVYWKLDGKGRFSVQPYYECLRHVPAFVFPWNGVWSRVVPCKVAFFVWTAALNSILTLDNLIKRKMVVVNRCLMCKCSCETIEPLLLHCPVVQECGL
jgi:hypothetical protein